MSLTDWPSACCEQGLNYKLSLFVSYHQLTEKLEIEGTIRTVEPFDGG